MTGRYLSVNDRRTYEVELRMVGKGKTKTPEYWMKCVDGQTKDPKNEYTVKPEQIRYYLEKKLFVKL